MNLKMGVKIFWAGLFTIGKWTCRCLAFSLPIWLPVLVSYFFFGALVMRFTLIGVLLFAIIGLIGISVSSEWDSYGYWKGWKE